MSDQALMSDQTFWIASLLLLALVFGCRFLYLQIKHNATERTKAQFVSEQVAYDKPEIKSGSHLYKYLIDEIGKHQKFRATGKTIGFTSNLAPDIVEAILSIVREDGHDVSLVSPGLVVYAPRPN